MPLVQTKPIRFRPRSLSDTLDGTNSPPGAASALVNLIADPSTPACLQCRPAAEILSQFASFNMPGVVSEAIQVNNRIYGLIASAHLTGHDEPFVFDLDAEAFVTVNGATSANTPATQPTSGDWTPPSSYAIGQRIIFTHPGFSALGNGVVFGYFDTSGFTQAATGNLTSGSNQITGNIPIDGIGPGYTVAGTDIPANTTITNVGNVTPQTIGNLSSGSPTISNVADFTDIAVGQTIAGLGVATGAVVNSFNVGAQTITMSINATANETAATISFAGTVITMSANATGTVTESITIAGGTVGSPLWAGGNTTGVPLAGVPKQISSYNNRPYFGVANAVTFCDPLSLNISNANGVPQTLFIGDNSPVTCLTPLTIINPATAAPVSGLLVFKEKIITLITGDPSTSNLANNTLSSSGIGTVSPNAVAATTVGVFFPTTDGVRVIELSGNITDPLPDVRIPFITAINPTRMSGTFNAGIYRCSLQSGTVSGTPFQEYWFDLTHKMWSGPHTFQQNVITAWKGTFIAFSNATPATLYQTDPVQAATSSFIENGKQLTWLLKTAPLPDQEDLLMKSAVVSSVNIGFNSGEPPIQCFAFDENNSIVGQAVLPSLDTPSLWGAFTWGGSLWFGQQYGLQPRQIPWTGALVFSKLVVQFSAASLLGLKISNFQALYQPLGYVATGVI